VTPIDVKAPFLDVLPLEHEVSRGASNIGKGLVDKDYKKRKLN
jgi:hypothetical protein